MRFSPGVEVIAHRGASAYAPEHTFAAYDLALAQGADALELDVRMTDARRLVVQHDRDPLPGPPPLELDAVLGRYGADARYLLELKEPRPPMGRLVLDALSRHGARERTVVQSFDRLGLRRIGRHDPALPLAVLFHPLRRRNSILAWIAAARRIGAVGVWHRTLDEEIVAACRHRGLVVRAWTVNDAHAIDRLVELGVDGVITDVPDVARAAVAAPALNAA